MDLDRKAIRFETQKTGRVVLLPLAGPLLNHLMELPAPDDPDAPVFPAAYAKAVREGRVGNLSNQFYEIQVAAGLAAKKSHKKADDGKGRDAKHQQNALVFHSLRHTFTSWLKNSGASEAVAMDMVGHDSSAVSQNYTHIDDGARRRAMALLPDITAPEGKAKGVRKGAQR